MIKHGERRSCLKDGVNPKDSESAGADHRGDGGIQSVSAATHGACRDFVQVADRLIKQNAQNPCAGTFSSVAIHRLPNVFSELQRDYPGIEYEMLLGDYSEVEHWIGEGRVDCGFLRLPTSDTFDTIPLERDEYKVVLPVGHPLAQKDTVSVNDLNGQPFLLLEHGGKTEVSDLLSTAHVTPDIRFTTWEDFAIMAMVEKGLGIGILPNLILRRVPYRMEIRPLAEPYYRTIGLAMKNREHLSPAVRKFIEYLPILGNHEG